MKENRPSRSSRWQHLDELLDEALRQTFPASDPVAIAVDEPVSGQVEPGGESATDGMTTKGAARDERGYR